MSDELSPQEAVNQLLDLINLEEIDENIYRGQNEKGRPGRLFGGQVAAQALAATGRTVSDPVAHSLHGYFLRPGDPSVPVVYTVDRIRDGKSFTTRRVVAQQRGRAIFNMSVSFHEPEDGYSHQFDMPKVPPPSELLGVQNDLQIHPGFRLRKKHPVPPCSGALGPMPRGTLGPNI